VFSLCYIKGEDDERPRYSFKLEYLLPFHQSNSTTIAGVPQGRLLGVAVAPVQGTMVSGCLSIACVYFVADIRTRHVRYLKRLWSFEARGRDPTAKTMALVDVLHGSYCVKL
jgi:hypothetical protein